MKKKTLISIAQIKKSLTSYGISEQELFEEKSDKERQKIINEIFSEYTGAVITENQVIIHINREEGQQVAMGMDAENLHTIHSLEELTKEVNDMLKSYNSVIGRNHSVNTVLEELDDEGKINFSRLIGATERILSELNQTRKERELNIADFSVNKLEILIENRRVLIHLNETAKERQRELEQNGQKENNQELER
jgi:aminoglycoside N3'-acetyltransferase